MNKAKRLEGEAIMSASPFFQSAGRGGGVGRVVVTRGGDKYVQINSIRFTCEMAGFK